MIGLWLDKRPEYEALVAYEEDFVQEDITTEISYCRSARFLSAMPEANRVSYIVKTQLGVSFPLMWVMHSAPLISSYAKRCLFITGWLIASSVFALSYYTVSYWIVLCAV